MGRTVGAASNAGTSANASPVRERRYLLIHGDESTAREVLTAHMAHEGGAGFGVAYLIDNPTRTITFRGGKLDPNRMFSNTGAEANLKKLNPEWTARQVDDGVKYLNNNRNQLVNRLIPPKGGLILAMHNNSRGYDIQTEIPISDAHALNDPADPGDFGLVVNPEDFAVVKDGPYNMVLQANPKGPDDGSLSRLAVKLGIRYVNLEAKLGNTEKQRAMLNWIEQRLA
jgi:hypothetical protein